MKGKKIVAALACTAMVAAVVVPLAACNKIGETTLNMSDYAYDYVSEPTPAYNSLQKVVTLESGESVSGGLGNVIILRSYDSSFNINYRAINVKTGSVLFSYSSYCSTSSAYAGGLYVQYIYATMSNDDYTVYAPDGTMLISGITTMPTFSYTYNSSYGDYILTVSGTSSVTSDTVKRTFYVDTSTSVYSYVFVSVSDSSDNTGVSVGDMYSSIINPVYSDENVSGEIAKYSYTALGSTYYFYDGNGNSKGTLDIGNGQELGFVGNYMYYVEVNVVDPEKTNGYNYMSTNYVTSKGNLYLHKYDIIEDKDTKLDADFVAVGMIPLYNNSNKSYDAAVIYGYKMNDGVAVYGLDKFAYVIDKDCNIAYDVSWYYQASSNSNISVELYNVGNGYYKLGSYLVDGSLKPLNAVSDTSYLNNGLISFTQNGLTGFTDVSGKVVLAAEYSLLSNFYGGVAYARQTKSDGTTKYVFINKNGTVTEVPEDAVVESGYYYIEVNGAFDFYNFNGTPLNHIVASSVSQTYGCLLFTGSDNSRSIYKLV